MTTMTMSRETLAAQSRLQRTLVVSVAAHALLFAWLFLHEQVTHGDEGVVEITWLDPAPPAPAPAPPPPAAAAEPTPAETAPVAPTRPAREERFLRREIASEAEPVPQRESASRDLVKKRLEALRAPSRVDAALASTAPASRSMLAAAAPTPSTTAPATGTELKRDTAPVPAPRALTRGKAAPSRRPAMDVARVESGLPAAAAEAPALDRTARRSLAGAELVGEVADRPVTHHVLPVYPDWAKEQAVEGTVTLRFTVLADGRVKENVQVERTAGFSDFDDNAVAALRQWRFEALTGTPVEQRGAITFRYRLRD